MPGYQFMPKFGMNPDVEDKEDLWNGGNDLYWPPAPAEVTLVCDDEEDAVGGTGAQAVCVQGLVEGYALDIEIADTNGASLTLSKEWLRIFRMYAARPGSFGKNVGLIQAFHGENLLAQIDAGRGQTQMAAFTIPADWEYGELLMWYCDIFRGLAPASAEVEMWRRNPGGAWRIRGNMFPSTDKDRQIHKFEARPVLARKSDIYLRVIDGTPNCRVIGGFDIAGTTNIGSPLPGVAATRTF